MKKYVHKYLRIMGRQHYDEVSLYLDYDTARSSARVDIRNRKVDLGQICGESLKLLYIP